ncbi:MAG: SAM-dependent methyltransferase [Acidiferrobacteraceae bacterium]|nr:SAM-dependent methyltransferase [Acidiferrobacteraceae bacterium]
MSKKPGQVVNQKNNHWQQVYLEKSPSSVSWYQNSPDHSLTLVTKTGISQKAAILDIGCGASVFVDKLLAEGFKDLSVLDISAHALDLIKARLGPSDSAKIEWHEGDITKYSFRRRYHLWHDRATFHFLTTSEDRSAYISNLKQSLLPGGHFILATFAVGGPKKCSGLATVQYDAVRISKELGDGFYLQETIQELHKTPFDTTQLFSYFWFIKKHH